MEFRQLDAYVHVYELKSFSKAAEEMFLSQPSISAYITSLEKELNTQLIFRSTKEFAPTKAGILFYDYAKEMVSLREKSLFTLKNISNSRRGSIDLQASSVPAQYILPTLLGNFHQLYPDITFKVEQVDSMEVVKNIGAHKGEIGFVGAKGSSLKCTYKEFMAEKLILIAPPEQRFLHLNSENSLSLIRNEHFVARETGSGTRLRYEEFLRKKGVEPAELKISAQLNDTQSIIRAVASGLGVSLVSEFAAQEYIQQNRIIPIDIGFFPERSFYTVLRKNCTRSPLVDIFLEFASSYASNPLPFADTTTLQTD